MLILHNTIIVIFGYNTIDFKIYKINDIETLTKTAIVNNF